MRVSASAAAVTGLTFGSLDLSCSIVSWWESKQWSTSILILALQEKSSPKTLFFSLSSNSWLVTCLESFSFLSYFVMFNVFPSLVLFKLLSSLHSEAHLQPLSLSHNWWLCIPISIEWMDDGIPFPSSSLLLLPHFIFFFPFDSPILELLLFLLLLIIFTAINIIMVWNVVKNVEMMCWRWNVLWNERQRIGSWSAFSSLFLSFCTFDCQF